MKPIHFILTTSIVLLGIVASDASLCKRIRFILTTSIVLLVGLCVCAARIGVVTLAWDEASPRDVTIVNLTTGVTTPVGDALQTTIGNLTAGSNYTFVATNLAGASNPVTTRITEDTNRLAISVFSFKLEWFGKAGVLQSSTNLVQWLDERLIDANSFFYVTNVGKQKFYRVRL